MNKFVAGFSQYPKCPTTRAEFGTAFGICLAELPKESPYTASEIRNLICPTYTVQKVSSFLGMAVCMNMVRRETIPTIWTDKQGNAHTGEKALFYIL